MTTVICAWCKTTMGTKDWDEPDVRLSHGMCEPCSDAMLGQDAPAPQPEPLDKAA